MFYKTFSFFATLCLLNVQVSAKSVVDGRDLVDVGHELLDEIKQFAEISVAGTEYEIDAYLVGIDTTVSSLYTVVQSEIDTIQDKVYNITYGQWSECINENTNEINKLSDEALSNAKLCANGLIKAYNSIVDGAKKLLAGLADEIEKQATALDACDADDTECVAGVIDDISQLSDTAPQTVLSASHSAVLYGETVVLPIEGCAYNQIEELQQKAEDVLDKIQACIE